MPVAGDLYTFNQENVDRAPTDKGVYSLHEGSETTYIGRGDGENGIRARLQAHLRGDEGSCTQQAKAYRREVCNDPTSRERELLVEYRRANGKLPRCNEVMPRT
jgi:hypothetical protein